MTDCYCRCVLSRHYKSNVADVTFRALWISGMSSKEISDALLRNDVGNEVRSAVLRNLVCYAISREYATRSLSRVRSTTKVHNPGMGNPVWWSLRWYSKRFSSVSRHSLHPIHPSIQPASQHHPLLSDTSQVLLFIVSRTRSLRGNVIALGNAVTWQ